MSAFDLQSEEDVKEYLEKLLTEYQFGCYAEKNAEACHLLGDYMEGIKSDYVTAAKLYRSSCDNYDFGRSCLKYGKYSVLGKGMSEASLSDAYKYFEKGCSLNEPDSCLQSGMMAFLAETRAEDRDYNKGVKSLTKSCDMNNREACHFLSGLYIAGFSADPAKQKSTDSSKAFTLAKDMSKAFNYATKACSLGNMYSCANLSQMYKRGDGTEKNEEKAALFKKLAKEMQDEVRKQQQTLGFQQGI